MGEVGRGTLWSLGRHHLVSEARREGAAMSSGSIPADWYPDPTYAASLRYWDGELWTDHRAAAPATRPLTRSWRPIIFIVLGALAIYGAIWLITILEFRTL